MGMRMKRVAGVLLSMLMMHGAFAADDIPLVTHDGLELVSDSDIGVLYAKPGISFGAYKNIALLETTVEFRKNWRRDHNRKAKGVNERVTKQEAAELKQQIVDGFMEVVTGELSDRGYGMAEFVAKDVLVLEPSIVNVDIVRPNDGTSIGLMNYSAHSGQMTLLVEVYDSLTGEIMARIIDQQSVNGDNQTAVSNRETTKAEGQIIFRRWAGLLGGYLRGAAAQGS